MLPVPTHNHIKAEYYCSHNERMLRGMMVTNALKMKYFVGEHFTDTFSIKKVSYLISFM